MSPHRRLELAKHLQQQGSWLAAAAAYAELAALVPSDHRFLANQANALWLADLPEAAHHCYSRALALQPDCTISRRGLASCLRDLNQFEEALELHQLLASGRRPPHSPVGGGGIGRLDRNRVEIPVQGQQGVQVSLQSSKCVRVDSSPLLKCLNPQLQARERSKDVMGDSIEALLARFGRAVELLEQEVDAMAQEQ